MLKMVLNNDASHLIQIINFNYFVTMEIDNYSEHNGEVSFNAEANSISNLTLFENTPISSIRILTNENVEVARISIDANNFYITNYTTNVYEGGSNNLVNMKYIKHEINNGEEE